MVAAAEFVAIHPHRTRLRSTMNYKMSSVEKCNLLLCCSRIRNEFQNESVAVEVLPQNTIPLLMARLW